MQEYQERLKQIKEFMQHDNYDDYVPLKSAIALKKKKRMLFLPMEFNNVKRDVNAPKTRLRLTIRYTWHSTRNN